MNQLTLTKIEIPIENLPKALDGFTICHFSDLHSHKLGNLEKKTIRKLAKLETDIVAFTGDMTSGSKNIDAPLQVIQSARSRFGTFAVFGNNEYDPGTDPSEAEKMLRKKGIHVLSNQNYRIPNTYLWIVGVDDDFKKRDDLSKALEGVSEDGIPILLAHSPQIIAKAIHYKIPLVLAGHTHGGQVALPNGRAIYGHNRYGSRLAYGHYTPEKLRKLGFDEDQKTHLFVTRGIGTSLLPIRMFCPPEIAVITLRRSNHSS